MAEKDIDITIMLERAVDRIGDFPYDPSAPYARPVFYAHIINLTEDVPTEIEVRLGTWYNSESRENEESITITPRSLNEAGDIYLPLSAVEVAIDQIRNRTQENHRARAAQVAVPLEGSAEEVGEEAGA